MKNSDLKVLSTLLDRRVVIVAADDSHVDPSDQSLIATSYLDAGRAIEGNASESFLVTDSPGLIEVIERFRGLPILVIGDRLNIDEANRMGLRRFFYVSNPDGSIRWFFPADQQRPVHLRLYSAQSLKGRFYHLISRVVFSLRKQRLLADGSFYLNTVAAQKLDELAGRSNSRQAVAFFTGTAGVDRKATAVVSGEEPNGATATHFVKIALSDTAAQLIANEAASLNRVAAIAGDIVVPHARENATSPRSLVLSDVAPRGGRSPLDVAPLHIRALRHLYEQSATRKMPNEVAEIRNAEQRLRSLPDLARGSAISRKLLDIHEQLSVAAQLIRRTALIPVALSHGDFVPWNSSLYRGRLSLYDWEFSRNDVPLLHDLFHFVFQGQVLVRHARFEAVLVALRKAMRMGETRRIIREHSVDVDQHLIMYLLSQVTFYAARYAVQRDLHVQAGWLMESWGGALREIQETHGHVI